MSFSSLGLFEIEEGLLFVLEAADRASGSELIYSRELGGCQLDPLCSCGVFWEEGVSSPTKSLSSAAL